MPSQLALIICILLILYLFWMDRKNTVGVSSALWLPFIWVFVAGSRQVSQWLDIKPPGMDHMASYMEGSPVDRVIFIVIILAGIMVIVRRRLNWSELLKKNVWIWLFFVYGLISILWSDYPFVSFKRWSKATGTVCMVLVILSDERSYEAIGIVLRRIAFVLLPLSFLFIIYYPELGRAYHMGQPMYTGVTYQKNSLGALCIITGIYFCWNLFFKDREGNKPGSRLHICINLIFLLMIAWLLRMANSATSLVCLIIAAFLFVISRVPVVAREPRRIMSLIIACGVIYGIMEWAFDVKDALISLLGRRPDFTDRVPLWNYLISLATNPILGAGYESFWAGERMENIWKFAGNPLTTSHNGYLDTYLHLGIAGLSILLISIVAGIVKATKYLNHAYAYAMLRIAFIVSVLLFNWTESAFQPTNNMFFLLLVGLLEMPDARNGKEMTANLD